MKKYLPYIIIFLIGAVAGMWLCRSYHSRKATDMVQRDTVVRYDTISYSRPELATNSCRLNIPSVSIPEIVQIPSDSVSIIYRDSVRYVTLPRQYFYTKVKDAEIWHSGIDSRIDSLNIYQKTTEQTLYYNYTTRKNRISLGIETLYLGGLYTPAYLEYERSLKSWLSVYGKVAYDLPSQAWGTGVGLRLKLEW